MTARYWAPSRVARRLFYRMLVSWIRLKTNLSSTCVTIRDLVQTCQEKVKSILGQHNHDDLEEVLVDAPLEPRRCIASRCLTLLPEDHHPAHERCDDCHELAVLGNMRYHRYTIAQPEQLHGRVEQGLLYGNLTVEQFDAGYWTCTWAYKNDTGNHRSPILDCLAAYQSLTPPEKAAYFNYMMARGINIDMVEAVGDCEFAYLPWVQTDLDIFDPFLEVNAPIHAERQQVIDDLVELVKDAMSEQSDRADMELEDYIRGVCRSFSEWYDTYIGGRTAHEDHIRGLKRRLRGQLLTHVVQTYLVWLRDECAAHPAVVQDIGNLAANSYIRDWVEFRRAPYDGPDHWDSDHEEQYGRQY